MWLLNTDHVYHQPEASTLHPHEGQADRPNTPSRLRLSWFESRSPSQGYWETYGYNWLGTLAATGRTGNTDIGVAWKKTSEAGNAYLSVQLDDPALAAPILCRLVKTGAEQSHTLVWERPRKRA